MRKFLVIVGAWLLAISVAGLFDVRLQDAADFGPLTKFLVQHLPWN